MIRNPVVAGQFYPGAKGALLKEVGSYMDPNARKENALGIVSPHAGYMYSGRVAGSVFSSIIPKETYIILGPNHTGLGAAFGLATHELWMTPLGAAKIDKDLAGVLLAGCAYIEEDNLPHTHEHSIEVQLPFIQFSRKDFKFVPIVVSDAKIGIYREIGNAIAKSVKELGRQDETVIVASSDMTHYESADAAKKKDSAAIEAILKLDEELLLRVVSELGVSMCGYAPTAIMITAAKELGAKRAALVKYQTSGDASGDYSSVVGYAGIVIS